MTLLIFRLTTVADMWITLELAETNDRKEEQLAECYSILDQIILGSE